MPVFAVDVPSGLNADTGEPFDEAISASQTITFIAIKQGLLTGSALNFTGDLCFDDLGLPQALYSHEQAPVSGVRRIDIHSVLGAFSPRPPASHKGKFGHVMVIGGDRRVWRRATDGGRGEFKKRCGSGFCGDAIRASGQAFWRAGPSSWCMVRKTMIMISVN